MVFAFGDKDWPGLAKLNEECGELVQEIGKLMMTHGDPDHWSGDLRKRLVNEMADVSAALLFVKAHCLTRKEQLKWARRVERKLKKFERWNVELKKKPRKR